MPKQTETSPTKAVQRIERLRRRMLNLRNFEPTESRISEMSALEWAIPILELYVKQTYENVPAARIERHAHQKQAIVRALIVRDGTDCYLCYLPMPSGDMTIDHVEPLSKGGVDNMTNYRLVHERCNLEKGNSLLEVYRRRQAQPLNYPPPKAR